MDRFPALLQGKDTLRDNAERLKFAKMAIARKRFAFSARLFDEAFESDPMIAKNLMAGHRYRAARVAALASSGQGDDDPRPDDAAKAKLREQALGWLKADLSVWTTNAKLGGPGDKEIVAKILDRWKKDAAFAGVRDEKELAKLPEADRKEWQALWADVLALLKRVEKPIS